MGSSYAFKHESDRNFVRQKIFGKKLLASAGVWLVHFYTNSVPRPCHEQMVCLWKTTPFSAENSNASDHADELTVTVQCIPNGWYTKLDCAVEFRILKISQENIEQVRNNTRKVLLLELQQLEPDNPNALKISGIRRRFFEEQYNKQFQ